MRSTWMGAYASAASYISGQRSAQSPVPTWVPMMTVNMGQGLSSGTGTDPSWSIVEAQTILANQPFAIGSQGLENGKPMGIIASDLFDIQNGPGCTGTNCCSNNWCNTRPMVIGQVPFIELQECNVSDPAGGPTDCLNSSLAGTSPPTDDSPTLSQVEILSSQHGTTSAEIYTADIQCAFDPTALPGGAPCSSNAVIQSAYAAAIDALALGQPSGTGALIGTAQTIGTVQIF